MVLSKSKKPAQNRHQPTAPAAPLVLIHGFRGTKQGLQLITKELSALQSTEAKKYALIAPDLPGFGDGATLKEYSLESYVKWLKGYIQSVQKRYPDQKVTLLGHSFGSIICAAYAAQYPTTIRKLILVNPIAKPALEGPKRVLTKLSILYYDIGAKLSPGIATRWLGSPLIVRVMSLAMTKTKDRELRTYIHEQHDTYFSRFHSPTSVLQAFKTSVNHNVGEFAHQIKTPTLLIAGSIDDITPLSDQYGLLKKFPAATLKVIDGVGHLTHYETPAIVARHIQAFIKSV